MNGVWNQEKGVMREKPFGNLTVSAAEKLYGGSVRYYTSTESCRDLGTIVGQRRLGRVLACCGGGDQALTLLGNLKDKGVLYAFDIQPAQLFVASAKAVFLAKRKRPPFWPTFQDLQKIYPDRIAPCLADRREIEKLYDRSGDCFRSAPEDFQRRFAFECDGGLCLNPGNVPFWDDDAAYARRIREKVSRLRLVQADFFYLDQHFMAGTIDMMYTSDIAINGPIPFYLSRLAAIVRLLKPGGRIVANADSGERFMGRGHSVAEILLKYADRLGLAAGARLGLLQVFERAGNPGI